MPANPSNRGGRRPAGNNATPKWVTDALDAILNEKDVRRQRQMVTDFTKKIGEMNVKVDNLEEALADLGKTSRKVAQDAKDDIEDLDDRLEKYTEEERSRIIEISKERNARWELDDKHYQNYMRNRLELLAETSDKADRQISSKYEAYQDYVKRNLPKLNDLYTKYYDSNNRVEKAWYKTRIDRMERHLTSNAEAVTEFYDEWKEQLDEFHKDSWDKTFEEMSKVVSNFTDDFDESMGKVGKKIDGTFGSDEGGLLSQIGDAVNQLSNIDMFGALNLNSLMSDLSNNAQSLFELKNELYAQNGIGKDMVQNWYNEIADINQRELKNTLKDSDILDIIKQMADMGVNNQEEFDRYYRDYLMATVGLGVSSEQLAPVTEMDQNLKLDGQLLETLPQQIASVMHDENLNLQTTSSQIFDQINTLDQKAMNLTSLSGESISNEALMAFNKAQLSAVAATENAMAGDSSLAQAYQAVTDAIFDSNVYQNQNLNTSLAGILGVTDLTTLRSQLMSTNEKDQQDAVNSIITAITRNAEMNGQGSLSQFFMQTGEFGLEGVDEFNSAIKNWSQRGGFDDLAGSFAEIQTAIRDADESDLTGAVEAHDVTLADQITNGITEHGLGQLASSIMGNLGISLSDLAGIMMLTNSLLGNGWLGEGLGKLGGKLGEKFGDWFGKTKIGGKLLGTGGDVAEEMVEAAGKGMGEASKDVIEFSLPQSKIDELADGGSDLAKAAQKAIEDGTAKAAEVGTEAAEAGTKAIAGAADDVAKAAAEAGAKAVADTADDVAKAGMDAGAKALASTSDDIVAGAAKTLASTGDDLAGAVSGAAEAGTAGAGSTVLGVAAKALGPVVSAVQMGFEAFEGADRAEEWTGKTDGLNRSISGLSAALGGTGNGVQAGGFWENLGEIAGNALKGAGVGAFAGPIGMAIGAVTGGLLGAVGGENLAKSMSEITDPNTYERLPENASFEDKLAVSKRNAAKVNALRPKGLAEGLSEVPEDSMTLLHKGEAVLTREQAEGLRPDGGIDVASAISNQISRYGLDSGLSDDVNRLVTAMRTSPGLNGGGLTTADAMERLSSGESVESIRTAIYGTSNAPGNLYSIVRQLTEGQEEYNTKSLKMNRDSYNVTGKMFSSINRLANARYTGTYVSQSTFKAESPSTKPAGDTDIPTSNIVDTLKGAVGVATGTIPEGTEGTVTNPETGVTVPVTPVEEAVRPKGTYAEGTPFLPEDQVALIHQGEMIVPAENNPLNGANVSSPLPSNDDVVEVLQWLGSLIARKMDEVEQVIQSSSAQRPAQRMGPYQQGPSMTDIAFRY